MSVLKIDDYNCFTFCGKCCYLIPNTRSHTSNDVSVDAPPFILGSVKTFLWEEARMVTVFFFCRHRLSSHERQYIIVKTQLWETSSPCQTSTSIVCNEDGDTMTISISQDWVRIK